MGIPGDKKRITGVLEGAEEAWGVIFEVIGGYWGFCGVFRRYRRLLVGFGFCKESWRVRGSQKWDHRGISRSLGPQEGFCEGGQGLFGAKIDLGGF